MSLESEFKRVGNVLEEIRDLLKEKHDPSATLRDELTDDAEAKADHAAKVKAVKAAKAVEKKAAEKKAAEDEDKADAENDDETPSRKSVETALKEFVTNGPGKKRAIEILGEFGDDDHPVGSISTLGEANYEAFVDRLDTITMAES